MEALNPRDVYAACTSLLTGSSIILELKRFTMDNGGICSIAYVSWLYG